MTPVPQGCVGLCMGLLSLVLSCQGRVAEEARHTVLLCSGGYTTVPGHPAALSVWPCARDGALQVKEAKQWILDAVMLSRSLTIQMCSFKYGHQLKVVSWSLEFSGAESCSLLNEVSTMHYFWCQDCAGNSIWLQVQSLLPSLLGTTSSIPTETELIERYRPLLIC